MKPGCTLHPLRTGFILFKLPSIKFPFWIWKIRHLKQDIEELVDAGARHIELVSDIIQFTPQFRKKFYQEIVHILEQIESFRKLKKNGLTISVHVDHIGYSFPSRFQRMRVGAISHFQYLISYYSRLNPTHYTLHPGPDEVFSVKELKDVPPIAGFKKILINLFKGNPNIFKSIGFKSLAIEEFLRGAPRAFSDLGEAGIDLSKVYIENTEGMTRAEFDELFGRLSKMFPQLGCLLDVGHLLMKEYLKNKNCVEDFIHYWGGKKGKIKAVHCHDVFMSSQLYSYNDEEKKLLIETIGELEELRKEFDQKKLGSTLEKLKKFKHSSIAREARSIFFDHQNLGTDRGILNLPSLLKALKDIDFKGPVIFEPGSHRHEETVESVKILAKEIEKVKKGK